MIFNPKAIATKWKIRAGDPAIAPFLSGALGVGPLLAQVMANRRIEEVNDAHDYLEPRLSSLPDPDGLAGMAEAVNRLELAIEKKETVGIFGDYDVDGVTSTTLLAEFLNACGLNVVTTIPNRLLEGYGLSEAGVTRLAEAGAQLIVTVDCGVTAHQEVAFARAKNIDVIVIDHHTVPVTLPEAIAIINPHRPDCTRNAEHLCAVGVTFNLCASLRRSLRTKGFFSEGGEPDLRPLLDLVALGTVADVVPLVADNRVFVRHGLRMISRQQRPGFSALMEVADIQPQRVTSGHLGFHLGPRVNAAGRLADAGKAVTLFQTSNMKDARLLAQRLDQENQSRRTLEKQIVEEAIAEIEDNDGLYSSTVLVVAQSHWHPGVVGIVASRLVERFGRPALVIGEGGKGSGRSIPAFHLHQALCASSEHLLGFGGHAHAAGVHIDFKALNALREALNKFAQEHLPDDALGRVFQYDGAMEIENVTFGNVSELSRAAPFGRGNPEPLFRFNGLQVNNLQVLNGGHLKALCGERNAFELIAFGQADKEELFAGKVDVLAVPEINRWRGREKLQLRVKDVMAAGVMP